MLASPLLSPLAQTGVAQPGVVRPASLAFSYDAAVAALKRQAARALDVHGGAPETAAASARPAGEAVAAPAPNTAQPRKEGAPEARKPEAHPKISSDAPAAKQPSLPNATIILGAGQTAAPQIGAAPAAALQASPLSAAGARDAVTKLKTELARMLPLAREAAGATKQFAEILAQRLESASQFDLRLDPPALGSIEGRLTLSDDGQAKLSLSFDNRSAFDFFRGDAAALRSALGDAGFDMTGRDLQFSFREPAAVTKSDAVASAHSFTATAPLHRGAVDIRV